MTLWIVLVLLCLVALSFVVWPLYRSSGRLTPMLATIIVLAVGLSAILYHEIGQPGVPSGAGSMPDSEEVVASLAERLEDNPDDVNGWILLGRSYQSMKQYDDAIAAFEKALELEQGQNAQTMVALAIALMESRGGELTDRSSSLFENALALEPNNPNALFYAGSAAARRGNTTLAADRWDILLGLQPPPEIRELLVRKVKEWRGLPPLAEEPQQEVTDSIVSLNLSLSEEAMAALPADATIYVIARDPAQPSPPIAVTPRRLAELPVRVDLSDLNAMVPGRPLSGFAEFEVVARVSLSGSPAAQSGDWSGSLIVSANSGQTIDLVINQEIP
jgi:cytochrome c-type biogenesis protein CcmH